MEEASAEPEATVEGEGPEEEMDEGRLEVFKDFVESLDLDDIDTEEDSED